METAHAILEKKSLLEEELRRVERQIYELEGEYLQETVKDGNILRGWDSYLGKQASSGAIRRINRFREADRMFSGSSVTSGQASTVTTSQVRLLVPRVRGERRARPPAISTRCALGAALPNACHESVP